MHALLLTNDPNNSLLATSFSIQQEDECDQRTAQGGDDLNTE